MSGSLTVVGSYTYGHYNSIVTVDGSFPSPLTPLQAVLSSASDGVVSVGASFENLDVAGLSGPQTVSTPGAGYGIFELTNSSVNGASTAGSANVSVNVPIEYKYLVVEAPGSETVNASATGMFAVFGSSSAVTFNSGGSGTVVAGGAGDYVGLTAGTWSVYASGGDSVASSAANASIVTAGSDNVVGLLGGTASVTLGGANDLIETYNSGVTGLVTVTGSNDRVLIDGGSDTVTAAGNSSGLNVFFNLSGGSLDFINNSTSAATVSGAVIGAIGGSVTAFGGAGGGIYKGGPGGNNSLVGGSGLVSLYGAGVNNLLSVTGAGTGTNGNLLSVGTSGSSTLIASASTTNNTFYGGAVGSTVMQSSGSGTQTFFLGSGDQETLTGSKAAGATNNYYVLQTGTGAGNDVITNFNLSTDKLYIDTIQDQGQVSVGSIEANGGSAGGSIIFLTDNTSITLYGISTTQLSNAGIGRGSTTI
jgi:hypothetical protein